MIDMKYIRVIILSVFMAMCSLPAAASNLLYGPWVANVTETGFTVLWVTEKPSLDYVEIAPADGSSFDGRTREKFYQTSHGRRTAGTYHCVRIDSLKPGTEYRYRIVGKVVEDDSNIYRINYGLLREISAKRNHSVRTLDPSAEVCLFSMMNDIHGKDKVYAALAATMDPKKTDFLVLNGDMVSNAKQIDTVIKHMVEPIKKQAEQIPLFYARGNHEGRGADFDKLYDMFPTSTGHFYYTFRQGPAAFVVLDAGEDKPDSHHEYGGTADYDAYREAQTEWLLKAVKEESFASAPMKICIIHIPTLAFRSSWYAERYITEHWVPILEKAGLDLALCAHHHKWRVIGAGEHGKNYPLLVNGNDERMDVVVTATSIDVKTYATDGTLVHQWNKNK